MPLLEITGSKQTGCWVPGENLLVSLTDTSSPQYSVNDKLHRTSVLFKVLQTDTPLPDISQGDWSVVFWVHKNPFRVLGRIAKTYKSGVTSNVYFGIGLASIITVTKPKDALPSAFADFESEELFIEEWKIINGTLTESVLKKQPKVLPYPQGEPLPADIRGDSYCVSDEFFKSVALARRRARLYGPDEVTVLDALEDEVISQVNDLRYLDDQSLDKPDGLLEYNTANPIVRERLRQQRIDRIVQINSSLSYVISQAYRGAPPVLQSPALIQRHSLLGVGRAHRAILNLVREVEGCFNLYSLRASIRQFWAGTHRLDGFGTVDECNTSAWKSSNLPDNLLTETKDEDDHKLVYFSGRLGFRESEYSVSASIHALHAADRPEWHLSTMTHEVLHGQVRKILTTIFDRLGDRDPVILPDYWQAIYERFKIHMTKGPDDSFYLIDSARNILLSYCCITSDLGSLTNVPIRPPRKEVTDLVLCESMRIPGSSRELRKRLDDEYRNISELIVHTLDLFYFYHDRVTDYTQATWRSWCTVPSVLRDVRQYVLRTILSVASVFSGDEIERFSKARHTVRTALQSPDMETYGPLIKKAADLLKPIEDKKSSKKSREANHPLFLPFFGALRIVDFSRHCLASTKIKTSLFDTEYVSTDDYTFDIEDGKFKDYSVESVAEFIAWRNRIAKGLTQSSYEMERQAAWLFLACGSL